MHLESSQDSCVHEHMVRKKEFKQQQYTETNQIRLSMLEVYHSTVWVVASSLPLILMICTVGFLRLGLLTV